MAAIEEVRDDYIPAALKLLSKIGNDVNKQVRNNLQWKSEEKDFEEIIEYLIREKGFDINKQNAKGLRRKAS